MSLQWFARRSKFFRRTVHGFLTVMLWYTANTKAFSQEHARHIRAIQEISKRLDHQIRGANIEHVEALLVELSEILRQENRELEKSGLVVSREARETVMYARQSALSFGKTIKLVRQIEKMQKRSKKAFMVFASKLIGSLSELVDNLEIFQSWAEKSDRHKKMAKMFKQIHKDIALEMLTIVEMIQKIVDNDLIEHYTRNFPKDFKMVRMDDYLKKPENMLEMGLLLVSDLYDYLIKYATKHKSRIVKAMKHWKIHMKKFMESRRTDIAKRLAKLDPKKEKEFYDLRVEQLRKTDALIRVLK